MGRKIDLRKCHGTLAAVVVNCEVHGPLRTAIPYTPRHVRRREHPIATCPRNPVHAILRLPQPPCQQYLAAIQHCETSFNHRTMFIPVTRKEMTVQVLIKGLRHTQRELVVYSFSIHAITACSFIKGVSRPKQ